MVCMLSGHNMVVVMYNQIYFQCMEASKVHNGCCNRIVFYISHDMDSMMGNKEPFFQEIIKYGMDSDINCLSSLQWFPLPMHIVPKSSHYEDQFN